LLRKNKICVFVLLGLFIIISPLCSQVKQSHSFVVGLIQLKDEINLGLVYNGFHLEYRYGISWNINDHEILYQPKLGVGIRNRNKFGMGALYLHFAPVNVTWTMPIYDQNGHIIRVGTNFVADYHFQRYHDFSDSNLFWTSEIGLSPVVSYQYQWDTKRIGVFLQNSLLGFTSHRQGYDIYSLPEDGIKYARWFFVEPHKDLQFGTFNKYNHTNVSLEFVPNISKMHSILYEFDYFGSYYGSRFDRLGHNLLWRISL